MTKSNRILLLDHHEFEVIFQVTYDLTNFDEFRLRGHGCTRSDLDLLLSVLRNIRNHADENSRIRIETYGENDPKPTNIDCAEDAVYVQPDEIVGKIPFHIAERWNALVALVVTAHSNRELFLRTGYAINDIRGSVARLGEFADEEE